MTFTQPNVAVVTPNGWIRDTILSVTIERTLNAVGQATIVLAGTNPFIDPETRIRILGRHNPDEPLREVFVGFVDTNTVSVEAGTITITCRDLLKKATDTFLVQPVKFGIDPVNQQYFYSTYTTISGGTFTVHQYSSLSDLHANHPETQDNITYEGVRAEAVVQWLLVMCGLREGDEILVQPTNFFIGDTSPVTFHLMSVYDAIMQIAELIGWDVYTDVHRVLFTSRGQTRGTFVCSTTSDIGNVLSLSVDVTNEPLRNYVEVVGASGITYVARAPSPYIGSTPYRGVLYASEYVDTPGLARFIAERILNDLNKLHYQYRITTVGNWDVMLQSEVLLKSTIPVPSRLKIESLTHTYNQQGFTTTINAIPVPQDVFYDEPPVELLFSITYLMTLGDPKVLVVLDASPSSAVVQIAQVQWVVDGVSFPWTEDRTLTVALDRDKLATVGIPVVLRVKDLSNITHEEEKIVTYDMVFAQGEGELYPYLYAALTTKAIGTENGGQTWNEQPIPAISVAASNFDVNAVQQVSDNYALFGCSDGSVYRTTDACRSIVLVLNQYGPVTHVLIHPLLPLIACCIYEREDVFISTDAGITWNYYGKTPIPIVDVEFVYRSDGQIAIQGVSYEYSFYFYVNISQRRIEEFVYGDVFASETRHVSTNFLGDSFTEFASALYHNHPHHFFGTAKAGVLAKISFYPGLRLFFFPNFEPIGVAAMTPDLNRPIIHVVGKNGVLYNAEVPDDIDSIYSLPPDSSRITSYVELVPATTYHPMTFAHALRDGTVNNVVYYATSSGVYKSLDGNMTVYPLYDAGTPAPEQGWGRQVAYGPLGGTVQSKPSNLLVHMVDPNDVYRVVSSGVYTEIDFSFGRDFLLIARSDMTVSSGITEGFIVVDPLYLKRYSVGSIDTTCVYVHALVDGTPQSGDPPVPPLYNPNSYNGVLGWFVPSSGNRYVVQPFVPSISVGSDFYKLLTPCNSFTNAGVPYITVPYTRDEGGNELNQYTGVLVTDRDGNVLSVYDNPVSLGSKGGGTNSSIYVHQFFVTPHTTSTRSSLLALRGGHPFVPKNIQLMIHVPSSISVVARQTPPGYEHGGPEDFFPLVKFDALGRAIVVLCGGGLHDFKTTSRYNTIWTNPYPNKDVFYAEYQSSNGSLSITRTPLSWQKPVIAAHKSFQHQGSVYYATDQNVYLVSDYGRGPQQVVFTAPSGYGIVSFTVTSVYPYDGLAVAVAKTENFLQIGFIYSSEDGGETWSVHRFRAKNSRGFLINAWVIAGVGRPSVV